ncbi:MAG: urease accessory protein UreE [Bacteroidetes bacterium]|nr:urease accessory protein UreE [Bacteroidota bacterium]
MLIQEKLGSIGSFLLGGREIDLLSVEWYETGKRIMRKVTRGGREVALRFLKEGPSLSEGDVLYADEGVVIVVEVLPCEVMVIRMESLASVASVCYEIGNRHLPLFVGEGGSARVGKTAGVLLAPFEEPLYRWLVAAGYEVSREERKLLYPLRSTVAGHVHDGSGSLFSKILQMMGSR